MKTPLHRGVPIAKSSSATSTFGVDHQSGTKSNTHGPSAELLDLFDVTLDNSAALRRQHQTLVPDFIHRSGTSPIFSRAPTQGFKRGPLAGNVMPAVVEEQAGQQGGENGLAWEGFESLQIITADEDDHDLSLRSRSDLEEASEGEDRMTSGMTRYDVEEDTRIHASERSYDSDSEDDQDPEYADLSRSSESEESEGDSHDLDYSSDHHCAHEAKQEDPTATTMDVTETTNADDEVDDDDVYEVGILLRLGADGKPIWPKDFSTMYRPKSFRRGVNYLDEPLKKGEKWVRLPDGKCCGSCQEWADREWQPKKGDKNWYPKLGCMVKVPVSFDPARDPAPPIEGGCAQCRCKNMAIDCMLATQNHPDGEIVERFPPPKVKVAAKVSSPKKSRKAAIPVPIQTTSPRRRSDMKTKPTAASPSKRLPVSSSDFVRPPVNNVRPFHSRSISTVSGSGTSSYYTALSHQTPHSLIDNIDLMSSSAADSYDTHVDPSTWLTCLRLLELVGENEEVEGGLSVLSFKRLRWVVADGIERGFDVPVGKERSKSGSGSGSKGKGKASASSRGR